MRSAPDGEPILMVGPLVSEMPYLYAYVVLEKCTFALELTCEKNKTKDNMYQIKFITKDYLSLISSHTSV